VLATVSHFYNSHLGYSKGSKIWPEILDDGDTQAYHELTHLLSRLRGLEEENNLFKLILLFIVSYLNRKSMFAVEHSDINSLKSGLVYLIGQPYCKKRRSAKVKGGIINLSLGNYLIDRYIPYLGINYPNQKVVLNSPFN
jgi:hypothetical protein